MTFHSIFLSVMMACSVTLLPACQTDTPSASTPSDTAVTTNTQTAPTDTEPSAQEVEQTAETDTTYEKDFGSYTVPQGWIEAETSAQGMYFYISESDEQKEQPDNVSINVGSNPYAAEEHDTFRQAILRQLSMQIGGQSGISLTGDGSMTENGDTLYTFTIAEEDTGITTTQYYIVGDYKFCLIQETNFTGSEQADTVAQTMVSSFAWA